MGHDLEVVSLPQGTLPPHGAGLSSLSEQEYTLLTGLSSSHGKNTKEPFSTQTSVSHG
jgi:hypothetical protein